MRRCIAAYGLRLDEIESELYRVFSIVFVKSIYQEKETIYSDPNITSIPPRNYPELLNRLSTN